MRTWNKFDHLARIPIETLYANKPVRLARLKLLKKLPLWCRALLLNVASTIKSLSYKVSAKIESLTIPRDILIWSDGKPTVRRVSKNKTVVSLALAVSRPFSSTNLALYNLQQDIVLSCDNLEGVLVKEEYEEFIGERK